MADEARWYVVHTFSGYEKKVQTDIEKTVENRGLEDQILDIRVPMEEVIETKGNEQKSVMRKVFPGYVMVKMFMTDESWYVIRNTRGVTGFVGPGSKPVALTDEEVYAMGIERKTVSVQFEIGSSVRVCDGPLADFVGVVSEIDTEKQLVKVVVSMFGRETPVELDFSQVEVLH
ncbi:MAG: transcription termination/antitermination protein NusG [Clostridia bacterium]|nr:transcription termination/antitermination protein NusG [Clostridia bacterium]MBQ3553667.1 transcription termination/antitermination protein NusG [Clostridia bacterium]